MRYLRHLLAVLALSSLAWTGNLQAAETYQILGQLAPGADTATVTISNATPGVITWNSHPLAAGDQVEFTTTGSLPTGLSTGTKYFVISSGIGSNSFQVSATRGGSAINTSSAGSGTHTAYGYQAAYTPSGSNSAVLSSMHVCNRSSSSDTVRIAVVADTSAIANKNWIAYGTAVAGNDCIYPGSTTLQNGGYIYIFSNNGTTNINLFGAEEN